MVGAHEDVSSLDVASVDKRRTQCLSRDLPTLPFLKEALLFILRVVCLCRRVGGGAVEHSGVYAVSLSVPATTTGCTSVGSVSIVLRDAQVVIHA